MADCGSKPGLARREFLVAAAAAGVIGSFPASASAILSTNEATTLAAITDTLVPGASAAGVIAFVQETLADPSPMHCYRFLGIPDAPASFYKAALAALDRFCAQKRGARFAALNNASRAEIVEGLLADTTSWDGPPFPTVYFAFRNDALDAVYGTQAAYDRLELPYMPHIAPTRPW